MPSLDAGAGRYKWIALSNATLAVAAGASLLRGGRYRHAEEAAGTEQATATV